MHDRAYDAYLVYRMRSDALWLGGSIAISALVHLAWPASFVAIIPLGITLPAAALLTIYALKRL